MTITLNGRALEVQPGTVTDLLVHRFHGPPPSGIAVAVNSEVVPRADWSGSGLTDGDVVEVVTAVQGG